MIGDVRQPGPLLIAEGFSTGATVRELTGHTAIVAFNAGNLGKVAQVYREQMVAGMGAARLSERSLDRDLAREREREDAGLER